LTPNMVKHVGRTHPLKGNSYAMLRCTRSFLCPEDHVLSYLIVK
jgi:hypothetical protein